MFYYQIDALLQDGNRQEHVSYMLKSSTYFRGKDVHECLEFQKNYLKKVIKFDKVVLIKLTVRTEDWTIGEMKSKGLSMKSIPSVEICD
jgi:hypothetical protein